ncbi:hypothetical protein C4K38_3559 [Pseudomonas chlororaphis subsp. piscium]|uniref:hypothetical protein n=1 Tax=Pseudomonas chlororaphis TaxID=587753 RepID=UPI0006A66000|nr:hypothetical protein [Pseudomonas chlororaphis]AZC31518.1 hypothetical protein C4K38_3559 [Pseudomonas chlororaphis subsp. piscium]WDG89306.1 hypothetical protein PUP49_18555 [Pseudomonas chlororaphis]SDS89908.1 hypothetical protein SAMN05216585_3827 [Pseudomonas chlororaphis]
MSEEIEVLKQLLSNGDLDQEDAKVSGIAKLAVDKGFDHLSAAQKAVLNPHLQRACEGVEDPGGYHNECTVVLEGKDLAAALEQAGYYGSVLCENCVNETEQYAREWDRIKRE